MGLLGDLIDDVLDIPAKVVAAPIKMMKAVICAVDEHEWSRWERVGDGVYRRTCAQCGAKEER